MVVMVCSFGILVCIVVGFLLGMLIKDDWWLVKLIDVYVWFELYF